jgi:hypothetical protein
LAPSALPRTLETPPRLLERQGLSAEAVRLLGSISLCDPVACLGEAPRLALTAGQWTIRFPDSYKKPKTETRDQRNQNPPPRNEQ